MNIEGIFMIIEIIGAGAVGLLVASCFEEAQVKVRLITKTEQQAVQLKENSLTRTNGDGSKSVFAVEAATNLSDDADLVIIAVKYHQLEGVYKQLQTVKQSTPVVFLQNGLAHYEEVLQSELENVAFCSILFGAQKITACHVAHKGIGPLKFAVAKGDKGSFSWLKNYSSERFPITFEQDAEVMLLEKAWLNCLINPLTAILRVSNGNLVQQKDALQLLGNLYGELVEAFPQFAQNVRFEQVVALCEQTANNISSMQADLLVGRKTEIETIVGSVMKWANRENKQLPILQTLYLLVKALEGDGEKM